MVLVDDDVDVTVPVGGTEQFRLTGFGTSGYQWFFRVDEDRIVRVVRASHGPESGARLRVGDSVDEVFIVEALNLGTATILFELARPWNRDEVARRYRATIRSEPRQ